MAAERGAPAGGCGAPGAGVVCRRRDGVVTR